MEQSFEVKLVNQDEYLVRAEAEGQAVESLFRVDPSFLEGIGLRGFDGRRVIEETSRFLARHQSVIDFPPMIDLEDIAAAYSDYVPTLQVRLRNR
jgi:hypothetical protein